MKMQLSQELTQRYELYAKIKNLSVTDAIQIALCDWMDTVGEGDIEIITGMSLDSDEEHVPFLVAGRSTSIPLVN